MKQDELKLWLDLLACQTELTLPLELPYFYMYPEWMSARAVLDLGTGPGYHLRHLATLFPEKSYVGVDIEEGYLKVAREGAPANTSFLQSDLFQYEGQYPIVMARLVAQHLPALNTFLCKVRDLLMPDGCFISIEPNDSLRLFHPYLPKIMKMFLDFKQAQKDNGHDRDAAITMTRLASSCNMQLERKVEIIVPSVIPSYKVSFMRLHQLLLQLFTGPFGLPLDLTELDMELDSWFLNKYSYAQFCISYSIFRKL